MLTGSCRRFELALSTAITLSSSSTSPLERLFIGAIVFCIGCGERPTRKVYTSVVESTEYLLDEEHRVHDVNPCKTGTRTPRDDKWSVHMLAHDPTSPDSSTCLLTDTVNGEKSNLYSSFAHVSMLTLVFHPSRRCYFFQAFNPCKDISARQDLSNHIDDTQGRIVTKIF